MSKMRWQLLCVGVLGLGLGVLPACKTDQPGVSSTYRSQYFDANADTQEATEAAEEALNDLELRNVEATATAVDGRAVGYTADGTRVSVSITRIDDQHSQVSVTVGTLGDPSLGSDIVARIKRELND